MATIKQKTLLKPVELQGVGLHSGKNVVVKICPAEANSGIVFRRTDHHNGHAIIPANFQNVTKTTLGTTISNKYGVEVATVEHLMAALWGAGVDNALIEISCGEVPIMDGSSEPFIEAINSVGLQTQDAQRKTIRIKEEIKVGDDFKSAILRPSDSFRIKFDIEFAGSAIGRQYAAFDFKNTTFEEVSRARTFGFKHDIDYMRANGLGLGGSLENAIVVDDDKIMNAEGLRFDDEFVRHKVLDSIGDLYLAGHIQGEFEGNKSGHQINNQLLRAVMDNPQAWEYVSA